MEYQIVIDDHGINIPNTPQVSGHRPYKPAGINSVLLKVMTAFCSEIQTNVHITLKNQGRNWFLQEHFSLQHVSCWVTEN
jgi:hypothetical protein